MTAGVEYRTGLIDAVYRRDLTEIRLILDSDVDRRDDKTVADSFRIAIHNRFYEVIDLFLSRVSADVRASDGTTPLMWCADDRNYQIAERLLSLGADVNALQDSSGQTALMKAALNQCLDLVKLFVSRGADLSMRDCEGRSALDLALLKSFQIPFVRVFGVRKRLFDTRVSRFLRAAELSAARN